MPDTKPYISTRNLMFYVPPHRDRVHISWGGLRTARTLLWAGASAILGAWHLFEIGFDGFGAVIFGLLLLGDLYWLIKTYLAEHKNSEATPGNLRRAYLAAKADPFLFRIIQSIMHRSGSLTNGEAKHIFGLGLLDCTQPLQEYQEREDAESNMESDRG